MMVLTYWSIIKSEDSTEQSPLNQSTEETISKAAKLSIPNLKYLNPLDLIIASLSDEEIIGQMLIFHVDGKKAPSKKSIKMIQKTNCSNFILIDKNCKDIKQVGKLVSKINQNNPLPNIPYLFCIDEEGGDVSRLGLGLPSAKKTGESKNPAAKAYKNGEATAKALKKAGIQLCLAPVLDTAKKPKKSSLGNRIYDSNPEIVSGLGTSFMKGLNDNGVASTVKHFPGIGNSSIDSHEDFPVIKRSKKTIKNSELIPFRNAIKEGADVVLVGHAIFPNLDKDNPATLSKAITTDLLRTELGFAGVIMTDDMYMDSITSNYNTADACLKAVLAGSDMILCLGKEQKVYARLVAATKDGTLSRERLEESMRRILKLKLRYA